MRTQSPPQITVPVKCSPCGTCLVIETRDHANTEPSLVIGTHQRAHLICRLLVRLPTNTYPREIDSLQLVQLTQAYSRQPRPPLYRANLCVLHF